MEITQFSDINKKEEEDFEDIDAMKILEKIFARRNKDNKELHYFYKIKSNYVYTELLTFLSLSNTRSMMLVCRKFKSVLEHNNCKILKLIGNNTYGLNKRIDFEHDPLGSYKTKAIKSNLYPIMKFIYASNLDSFITSPGPYNEEIKIWSYSNKIFKAEILTYKPANNNFIDIPEDNQNSPKVYVSAMAYMTKSFYLVVGFSNKYLVAYNIQDKYIKNSLLDKVEWAITYSDEDILNSIVYNEIENEIITLETNTFLVNFIKVWCNKGKLLKTAIHLNEIITSSSIFYKNSGFDNEENNGYTTKDSLAYYCFGTENGVINILEYSLIENNFSNLSYMNHFKGPVTEIENTLYIPEHDYLVVSYRYIGLYVWDISNYLYSTNNKNSIIETLLFSNQAHLVCTFQYDSHLDPVTGLIYLGNSVFASSSEDSTVILWSYENRDMENEDNGIINKIVANKAIYHINFNKSKNEIITTCYDKNIRLSLLSSDFKKTIKTELLNSHSANITSWQVDFLTKTLYSVSVDKIVKVWDFNDISLLQTIELGKEFCDGFIIIKDQENSLVKVDSTKNIKFMKIDSSNNNKYIAYHTVKDDKSMKQILNLLDGISFAVGYTAPFVGIYYYYTEDVQNVKCRKVKEIEHKYLPFSQNTLYRLKFFMSEKELEDSQSNDNEIEAQHRENKGAKITKLQLIYLKKFRFIVVGASNATASIFDLKSYKQVAYTEFGENISSNVKEICPLIINFKNFKVSFLLENGDLYIQDFYKDSFPKKYYSSFTISTVDKLNDSYFVVGYNDVNKIEILDCLGNRYQSLNTTFKGIKMLAYMRDGRQILVYNGSALTGFSLDLFSFNY